MISIDAFVTKNLNEDGTLNNWDAATLPQEHGEFAFVAVGPDCSKALHDLGRSVEQALGLPPFSVQVNITKLSVWAPGKDIPF